jgi:hypothetical protein
VEQFIIRNKRYVIPVLVLLLFAFRLIYGLCSEFWGEDEMQVYLIGLKFYSTNHFPYFGPDIVYTQSQIPGSLQGLMTGLPFYVWPVPEAPFILLNLLSMAALCIFALYLQKKFPGVPIWFTWIWIFICPWAINYSAHVINPSYVLFGAVLFFIGFFESIPKLAIGFVKIRTAFFLMGFSLFWIYQFHMSWVLLLPLIGASFWINFRREKFTILYFLLGSLITAAFVIPTYLKYGLLSGSGGVQSNIVFNFSNLKEIANLIMRFLSFATFELWHFIDFGDNPKRQFFTDHMWAAPFMFFVIAIGVLQAVYLFLSFFPFINKNKSSEFKRIKIIVITVLLITYLSFLFSVKAPSSHTFLVLFPLVMIYSFYCWQPLFAKRSFKILMIVMLFSGIITNATLARYNYYKVSMYRNRELPQKAIQQRDYRILSGRRSYDRNE